MTLRPLTLRAAVPARAALVAALSGAVLVAAACGGSGKEGRAPTASVTAKHAAQQADVAASSFEVMVGSESPPQAAGPNLPGITVVGAGEAKGAPDKAILRLTIGSGNEFSGPEGVASEPLEETELEPVVEALKQAGALANTVTVNTYATSPYAGFGSAGQVTATWPHPREVDKAVEAVQRVVRAKTRFSLQNVETLFTTRSCAGLEDLAWKAALADARRRAARLAGLSGAGVGAIISVSEAPGVSSPYSGSGLQGCQALRSLPPSLLGPSFNEGTPDAVKVAVTLQVTFAFKSK